MPFVLHYIVGMPHQEITEKEKNYVKWNYLLFESKKYQIPLLLQRKVKAFSKSMEFEGSQYL